MKPIDYRFLTSCSYLFLIAGPQLAAGVRCETDSGYFSQQPTSISSAAHVSMPAVINKYITSDPSDSFMSWPDEPAVNTNTTLDADSLLDGTAANDAQYDSLFGVNDSDAGDYNIPSCLDDLNTDFIISGDNTDSFFSASNGFVSDSGLIDDSVANTSKLESTVHVNRTTGVMDNRELYMSNMTYTTPGVSLAYSQPLSASAVHPGLDITPQTDVLSTAVFSSQLFQSSSRATASWSGEVDCNTEF